MASNVKQHRMQRLTKIASYVGGVFAALILFRLGAAFGVAGLLFVVSLAAVGAGNRLAWALVFPLLAVALAAVAYAVFAMIPEDNERLKLLLAFGGMPVVPGIVVWAAIRFKRFRSGPQQSVGFARGVSREGGGDVV